jgi:hypothetical protein
MKHFQQGENAHRNIASTGADEVKGRCVYEGIKAL